MKASYFISKINIKYMPGVLSKIKTTDPKDPTDPPNNKKSKNMAERKFYMNNLKNVFLVYKYYVIFKSIIARKIVVAT